MNKVDELFINGKEQETINLLESGYDFQLFKSTCIFQCLLHRWLNLLRFLTLQQNYKITDADIFDLNIQPGTELDKFLSCATPYIWASKSDYSCYKQRQLRKNK